MNQSVSGEISYKIIDDMLEKYEKNTSEPSFYQIKEITTCLNYTKQELSKLNIEELADIQYMLGRYALYLQGILNNHNAVYEWCDSTSKIVVADQVGNYKGISYEERKLNALKENSYGYKLFRIKDMAKFKANKLMYMPERIRFLSSCIQNIISIKLKR